MPGSKASHCKTPTHDRVPLGKCDLTFLRTCILYMSLWHFQIRGGKCNTMIFPFLQKKKKKEEKETKQKKAWTWSTQSRILFPRQKQGKKCQTAQQQYVSKPNLKQEKACLMQLTQWKSKFTLFQKAARTLLKCRCFELYQADRLQRSDSFIYLFFKKESWAFVRAPLCSCIWLAWQILLYGLGSMLVFKHK